MLFHGICHFVQITCVWMVIFSVMMDNVLLIVMSVTILKIVMMVVMKQTVLVSTLINAPPLFYTFLVFDYHTHILTDAHSGSTNVFLAVLRNHKSILPLKISYYAVT